MDLLIAQLDETGIDYELIDCDPDLADTAQFCEAYGFTMEQSANTILVVGKSDPAVFAACLVLAHTRLDVNKVVRKRFGVKKASFASGDDTVRLTGMQIGGVTPFGLPHDLPIWIDSRVLDCPQIILGGGSRSRKVLVAPRILIEIGAEVVEDLAKLPPPPT
ncbi:MAG: prolyl-tRNA editing enzyme YbaK/EbsC (Cys-tRNA(Pro) deacylase) [Ilumatobacter sp.]|jgi:prolyl-tRNA editing enzyme YbaK/EbsC (Cys-tRNA(Pro) deacylase)